MNNKLLLIILFIGILTSLITVVYAKNSNFCSKQNIIITLKNEVDIAASQKAISKIPQTKIINIKDRNEEWSKMVNKYDLPNMENPFKNEFVIKINKNADIVEIYNKIKEMSFIEDVKYASKTRECIEKQK